MTSKLNQPDYDLIKKDGKIEIRQYSEYVIAKTSIKQADIVQNNNMFRTLAGYIFGGNTNNQSIPMTAPVITQNNNSNYDMIFFMLDAQQPEDLPHPNNPNISLEHMKIGKTISLSFGMWATEKRVSYYKEKLDKYINQNQIEIKSSLMVAQYNSPWAVPPFRKNELLYTIK
tara:strand:+ start:3621 stop:4136 length:516 start_codon:yes stop_codon:yes gene_type:complete